uniref:Uncharacterized protein n=1 Tax=Timema bartmani TaxID=61472 RepID=A0A7R9I5R8_9NEOP|nr:unnamed protein product [Timema bartmani]
MIEEKDGSREDLMRRGQQGELFYRCVRDLLWRVVLQVCKRPAMESSIGGRAEYAWLFHQHFPAHLTEADSEIEWAADTPVVRDSLVIAVHIDADLSVAYVLAARNHLVKYPPLLPGLAQWENVGVLIGAREPEGQWLPSEPIERGVLFGVEYSGEIVTDGSENMKCRAAQAVEGVVGASAEEHVDEETAWLDEILPLHGASDKSQTFVAAADTTLQHLWQDNVPHRQDLRARSTRGGCQDKDYLGTRSTTGDCQDKDYLVTRSTTGDCRDKDYLGTRSTTGDCRDKDYLGTRSTTGDRRDRDYLGTRSNTGDCRAKNYLGTRSTTGDCRDKDYLVFQTLQRVVQSRGSQHIYTKGALAPENLRAERLLVSEGHTRQGPRTPITAPFYTAAHSERVRHTRPQVSHKVLALGANVGVVVVGQLQVVLTAHIPISQLQAETVHIKPSPEGDLQVFLPLPTERAVPPAFLDQTKPRVGSTSVLSSHH